MILQLDPPIPLSTPKGNGLAWFVTDYGSEYNLLWTVAINETGEIWTFQNPEIRAEKNITMGRISDNLIKTYFKGVESLCRRIECMEDEIKILKNKLDANIYT